MVLISLAILFAAIGALSLTGSDDSEDTAASDTTSEQTEAPATSAVAPAPTAEPESGSSAATTTAATTSVDPADVEVRVLNNSDVSGLAADTAATLTSDGWTIAETGNYAASQIPSTTVYYGTGQGEQAAAQQIAQQLGATAQARPSTLSGFGTGVIVMVTQ
ncbi:LytR cell envelope-related transcriptional attenuator [Rhodococcoides kyotonense]|uniref:LytR cell envelope-related transcriptional attenuator n=2 Tax=Rhodococcoides kyotonense TaxID=398843 RepID=A0A239G6E3_9NOCA|nr:LytR cell envelope-related transcriptional attenuator [Rhodococcus kyotonensis]